MDYEKKYNEAFEIARQIHNGNPSSGTAMVVCEQIFPQLRESEDERIRKWIMEELEITRDAMSGKNPYSDDPDIVARLKRLAEAIYYLDGQKDFAANEYWRGFGNGRDEVIANPDAFNLQKEQKPIGIYWHKIKEGEKLPCRAYVWNIDYEKHYDCFEGRLIANLENISVGRDTWYLPADDVRNLPREGVDELPREQKPDIELIQRSWYMEGYHDRKFGMEPKWIIKTEEGGPKHELNPRYGQHLEPKPAKWSEDYNEENLQTRFAFYTYKDDPSTLYLSNVFVEEASRNHGFGTRILKAAEKAAEAIGAITICLKVKQDSPANAWYRKHGYGYVAFEDGYDWLEKNLEYMKPVKQEWSEEDERCINGLIGLIEDIKVGISPKLRGVAADRCIAFLKSLRPQPQGVYKTAIESILKMCESYEKKGIFTDERAIDFLGNVRVKCKDAIDCAPILDEPSWKPSEEQMDEMEFVINDYREDGCNRVADCLQEILEQMKKL